jgi:hypothetical protein
MEGIDRGLPGTGICRAWHGRDGLGHLIGLWACRVGLVWVGGVAASLSKSYLVGQVSLRGHFMADQGVACLLP